MRSHPLVFTDFDWEVKCKDSEFAVFDPPAGQTCAQYLSSWMDGPGSGNNLINPSDLMSCKVCPYAHGSDYLRTLKLSGYGYGWRYAAICVIFTLSSYALVFFLMKLRTKASKKAE